MIGALRVIIDSLYTENLLISTSANSEDPDEMPHNAAFHQGLHCLLRLKQFSEKEIGLNNILFR